MKTNRPVSGRAREPMRITFVLPHAGLAGGIRVVAIYAEALQARGHKVVILSSPYRLHGIRAKIENCWHRLMLRVTGKDEPSHLNDIDVEHRRLPSPDYLDAADIPPSDVVISTWWETAEQLAALNLPGATKVYFLQHHEAHDGQPIDRVNATWRLPMQKIVVAQWLADLARNEFGDSTAINVPNAVDLEQFSVPARGKQSKPTVGMMYSNARFKGCDICIKAIEIARRTIPDLQVAAFGMAEFPEETKNLPRDTHYTQMPEQDRIKDIYASCDAWLFGSRSEGFGLPLLEAMACRTPVIATPAGAAPELVGQGGGMLVKSEDAEDMAAAIVRIARMQEGEWKRLSDRALEIAKPYTWEHASDLFEAALRAAVERSQRDASQNASRPSAVAAA